jgi:hypothetical protein
MPLLVWRFERPDGTVLDRVRLEADGAVARLLTHPGAGPAPELGWWQGTFDAASLAAASTAAAGDWSVAETAPVPSVAGRWVVAREDGAVLALALDDPASDLVAQLSALRGAVLDAADQPVQVARLTSRWADVGGERHPLLDVASVGLEPVRVRVAAGDGGGEAAFLNDDAETVGFLGDDLELAPGTHAFALLRVPATDAVLHVDGDVAGGDPFDEPAAADSLLLGPPGREALAFEAAVEVVG